MDVGVEFHSLSKTYSMTGWRLGFSVGNAGAIAGLGKIKTNVDSGVFQAVQEAGIAALTGPQDLSEQYRRTYQDPARRVVAGLKRLGWRWTCQGRLLRLGPVRAASTRARSRAHAERGRLRDHPRGRLRPLRRGLLPHRAHHRRKRLQEAMDPPPGLKALSSDKIFLEDVRFYGHHGVTKAQQTVGAWFAVDAELMLDLAAAAASDDLRSTVDYGLIAARIVEVSTKERVNLLERLAGTAGPRCCWRSFSCEEVRVRVRKLTPPMEGLQGIPGVELTRRRR